MADVSADIKSGQYKNVYLIHGDERYLRENTVNEGKVGYFVSFYGNHHEFAVDGFGIALFVPDFDPPFVIIEKAVLLAVSVQIDT